MTTDITVGLVNQPGTLLRASDALGRAGINIEGACGYVCDGQGVYHVLVDDARRARSALMDAGVSRSRPNAKWSLPPSRIDPGRPRRCCAEWRTQG